MAATFGIALVAAYVAAFAFLRARSEPAPPHAGRRVLSHGERGR